MLSGKDSLKNTHKYRERYVYTVCGNTMSQFLIRTDSNDVIRMARLASFTLLSTTSAEPGTGQKNSTVRGTRMTWRYAVQTATGVSKLVNVYARYARRPISIGETIHVKDVGMQNTRTRRRNGRKSKP